MNLKKKISLLFASIISHCDIRGGIDGSYVGSDITGTNINHGGNIFFRRTGGPA